jgi:hypothetical protein
MGPGRVRCGGDRGAGGPAAGPRRRSAGGLQTAQTLVPRRPNPGEFHRQGSGGNGWPPTWGSRARAPEGALLPGLAPVRFYGVATPQPRSKVSMLAHSSASNPVSPSIDTWPSSASASTPDSPVHRAAIAACGPVTRISASV